MIARAVWENNVTIVGKNLFLNINWEFDDFL